MINHVPAPVYDLPPDAFGPSYGVGMNGTEAQYSQNQAVSGTPSIQPATYWQAPNHAWRYGDIALLQVHAQLPYIGMLYAPPVPSRVAGYDEIAYQIFHNGDVVGAGISLKAPPINTGGYGGCGK